MWTMEDYPDSWKNLDQLERKKAIDIGNAMLKDGYEENHAIPIATTQAEDWYKNATKKELESLKNKKITTHKKDKSTNPDLIDEDVEVYFEDDEWKVKTTGATQPSVTFNTKKDAVKRAEEIADNRGTKVIKHTKDES